MSHRNENLYRLRVSLRGAVQGVGFRPFVYRLARELRLAGWVSNSSQGLRLEVEGAREILERFLDRLRAEAPPRSAIASSESSWLDPVGHAGFVIRESEEDGGRTALILPDIATCQDCLAEIRDPANRRYQYPFTNCTNCGPRFSIVQGVPYDRARTTMREFVMCEECRAEYETPSDRRFHAQPIACPRCGPRLEMWDATGRTVASESAALKQAARLLKEGNVVALKGLGGFQLLVLAGDENVVQRLRLAKHREAKPFAVMVPNLEAARAITEICPAEERLLTSPEAPIVLLRARAPGTGMDIAPGIAPGNPWLGLMLPYTPLHHILLQELGLSVVATSGNLKDEPICIDEREALVRLRGIADYYLTHNRPIARPIDDSVARVVMGRELLLRRARGYAPLPIHVTGFGAERGPILGVGAHLKNTIAVQSGSEVFLSPHVGDLETMQAYDAFQAAARDLPEIYEVQPVTIVADKHPDYLSSRWATAQGTGNNGPRIVLVQHHVAHVLSCLAENELAPPALGVAWDGTGYGEDGTVWGGEFFHLEEEGYHRIARIRPFALPGGERAVKEPRRSAAGLLYAAFGEFGLSLLPRATHGAFDDQEAHNLRRVLGSGLNCPSTSSAGRLFDAVASLAGLRQHSQFEGQSAMELEFSLPVVPEERAYPMVLCSSCAQSAGAGARPVGELNWEPMLREILEDVEQGIPVGTIAAKFHNSLVRGIVQVASKVGERRVVLSGGCFQNRYLLEQTVTALRAAGFKPYWHQRVPPNDGGISLGQVVAAQWGKV